ncbi:hypothetical protein ACFL6U_03680 [Planctomycetota bacterium]
MLKTHPKTSTFLALLLVSACLVLMSCKKETPPNSTHEGIYDLVNELSVQPEDAIPFKRSLRILYAGNPGSSREENFVGFLSKHFDTVGTCNLAAFKESDSDDYDLTIMDYDGDGFKAPRPRITQSYTKPVITMGVPGAFICGSLDLKLGYL